jgi:hypothetical protein
MLTLEFKMEEAVEVWKEEGKEEMARGLLADGVSPDIIAKHSGLSLDTLKAMIN